MYMCVCVCVRARACARVHLYAGYFFLPGIKGGLD